MPNNRTSEEKVERRTLCFAPDYWSAFKNLCLKYNLGVQKTNDIKGVSLLFRALYITYRDNENLIAPLLIKTIADYNLTKNVKPTLNKKQVKSIISKVID